MNKKKYINIIHSPLDTYEYKFMGVSIPKESTIFIEQIGGSDEEITFKYEYGVLLISTPCFVVNPKYINIGYETKQT